MVVLPFALLAGGLTLTSATDVVIFAIACMALNILVGHTGLVSFGHGAWFGLGAYAAALTQKYWFPGSVLWPALFALAFLLVAAVPIGFLVLRRRGVYFSLLTLAFSALTYAVAFRWTCVHRRRKRPRRRDARELVRRRSRESLGLLHAGRRARPCASCTRSRASTRRAIGTVLVAIRENEQRAQFVGYATNRYKQIAYVVSATLTGFAGVLFAFHHRFASADPTAVSFSGELLAMVIIGGMRSLLGPALGALFYILFREYLSIWTPNWLLFFGLLFVGFIVFSPTGLVGVWRRLTEPLRPKVVEAAAMAGRSIEQGVPLPAVPARTRAHAGGVVLEARDLAKSFGGIKAVTRREHRRRRSHAARADRAQRRRQDDGVQPRSRACSRPIAARSLLAGRSIAGLPPHRDRRGRARALVPDHQPVSRRVDRTRTCASRCRRATRRISTAGPTRSATTRGVGAHGGADPLPRPVAASSARRRDRCRTAGSGCSTWASRSPARRACCCSTSRSPVSPRPSASASPA